MNFADIKQDTPRLVILYKVEDGKPSFGWGMSPGMPLPHLIGYIGRVQVAIANGVSGLVPCEGHKCSDMAFVIVWDGSDFEWWSNENIPVDPVLGILESIKVQLVTGIAMQRVISGTRHILGPDGNPMRN